VGESKQIVHCKKYMLAIPLRLRFTENLYNLYELTICVRLKGFKTQSVYGAATYEHHVWTRKTAKHNDTIANFVFFVI